MTPQVTSREVRLASRPSGWPEPANFAFANVELAPPGPGEAIVRTTVMSVEPYMRGRMNDVRSYIPPFQIGEALSGGAVGFVVASAAPELPVGTWVHHQLGWREYARGPAKQFQAIDVSAVPASAYLGALGTPGFTAWIGIEIVLALEADDVLFVSSAAGAVGSIVCQLAKRRGARVIGSAGSAEKVEYLTKSLGCDAAFDYHGGDVRAKLKAAAPDGISAYFDNVGGEQLEAALDAMRDFGRIAVCGAISSYNEATPGPRNFTLVIPRRLRIEGFIVIDHMKRFGDFVAAVAPDVAAGKIVAPESYSEGIDAAPQAFVDMLRGGSGAAGKALVRLAPEGTKP